MSSYIEIKQKSPYNHLSAFSVWCWCAIQKKQMAVQSTNLFYSYKAQIYFTGYKWMFLNDNQIYVTTKFMHSTQILVSVLAKKTFVCTLSASISDAASSPPQKPYTSRLTDKALRISARASHIINQPFIRSNLFSGDYQRNDTNMAFIIKWFRYKCTCKVDT